MCKVWKKNGGKKKKKNLCQIVTQQRYSGNGRLGGMCFGETGAKVNKWWKWINSRFEESSHPASSQNPNHVSQSTTLRKNSTYRNHKKVSFWWEIPAHITWPIFHLQPFTSSISRSYGHWGENLATTAGVYFVQHCLWPAVTHRWQTLHSNNLANRKRRNRCHWIHRDH